MGGMGFATFVLAHDVLYLAMYGADFRSAMARTGHGELWAVTMFSAIGISLAILTLAARRLWVLRQLAASAPAGASSTARGARWSELLRGAARIWVVIGLVALALFVVSENWERHAVGLPLPGLGVLLGFPASPAVLGIFASIAGLVASVATLYRWRHEVLASQARLRARLRRPDPRELRRTFEPVRPAATPLARRIGGRAPPVLGVRGTALPFG